METTQGRSSWDKMSFALGITNKVQKVGKKGTLTDWFRKRSKNKEQGCTCRKGHKAKREGREELI